MKSCRPLLLMMVVALGLSLVPVSADMACGMDSYPGNSPCNESPFDQNDDPCCNGDPQPDDDFGCGSGCQHCSLPCCAGMAMVPPWIHGLEHAPTVNGHLLAATSDAPRVTAVLLYRPPRD